MEVTGLVPVTKHRVDRPRTHSTDQGGFLEPLGTGAPFPRPLPLTAGFKTASVGRRCTAPGPFPLTAGFTAASGDAGAPLPRPLPLTAGFITASG